MNYDGRITGRIIAELRRQNGMTQEVLSGLAGLARSHLAEIESERTKPNVETLWRIAEALGMKLSTFIEKAEERME